MQPKMIVTTMDVEAKLWSMGVPPGVVRSTLMRGEAAYNSCTENDPVTAPGTQRWFAMTRALREGLLPLGWTMANPENQPLTINRAGTVAIVAAAGDENTGLYGGNQPKTKSQKGPCMIAAVQANAFQSDMFAHLMSLPTRSKGKATWLLLTFRDKHELRAELSLATSITGLRVDGWEVRIILPSISAGPAPLAEVITKPDLGPDIIVPVKRRA